MNYYETLYILHPALDAGRVKEMVLSINKTLEKTGASVAAIDVWGKKKLAYEIDKQKYGSYILLQFTSDGSGNANFNVELEHNPNVLAYLTIKIDENKILNQKISLDEQISGVSPSNDKSIKKESIKISDENNVKDADNTSNELQDSNKDENQDESKSDESQDPSTSDTKVNSDKDEQNTDEKKVEE